MLRIYSVTLLLCVSAALVKAKGNARNFGDDSPLRAKRYAMGFRAGNYGQQNPRNGHQHGQRYANNQRHRGFAGGYANQQRRGGLYERRSPPRRLGFHPGREGVPRTSIYNGRPGGFQGGPASRFRPGNFNKGLPSRQPQHFLGGSASRFRPGSFNKGLPSRQPQHFLGRPASPFRPGSFNKGLPSGQPQNRLATPTPHYMFSFPGSIIQQYPMTIAQGNKVRECYTGRGKDYIGHVNTTVSGNACQSWEANRPISHSLHGMKGNYCRNPMMVKPENCQTTTGCIRDKPWCYTLRKYKKNERKRKWEFCTVPKCED